VWGGSVRGREEVGVGGCNGRGDCSRLCYPGGSGSPGLVVEGMSGGAVSCQSARSSKRFTVGLKIGSWARFLISGRSLWLNNNRGCARVASVVEITLPHFTVA